MLIVAPIIIVDIPLSFAMLGKNGANNHEVPWNTKLVANSSQIKLSPMLSKVKNIKNNKCSTLLNFLGFWGFGVLGF